LLSQQREEADSLQQQIQEQRWAVEREAETQKRQRREIMAAQEQLNDARRREAEAVTKTREMVRRSAFYANFY
jgi:hypothetical protein